VADDTAARFAALVSRQDRPLPVDEALLLVAVALDPTVDVAAEQARLDDLAAGVEEPTVDALCHHLFTTMGFTGDRDDYYDARNSLLPAVLDRRLGIPLSLAVVTMEVGRRSGVAIEGIGMPGHYLVRPVAEPARFLDVFDAGRELDVAGCRAIFQVAAAGMPWDDRYLRADAPWSIVVRTLANLAGAHRRSGDRAGLCTVLELRMALPAATEQERRELGMLLGAAGRFDEGAAVLEASGVEADQEVAARLRARLN